MAALLFALAQLHNGLLRSLNIRQAKLRKSLTNKPQPNLNSTSSSQPKPKQSLPNH
ncbi:hypothetical protein [Nostoc sp. CHAB 5715]|uniref:hypothetical protein n=1 Tax=Nostoc sp. CHAB 5715 TaxID=2780400 RepID=UPI001E2C430C|nr:hypothetical protein [Nostoc sp. CHAB 5715]MCC5625714.1 hypothetical protein [Nostoc sp. CHAB 5715]